MLLAIVIEPRAGDAVFQYHFWFNLKSDAAEAPSLNAARAFLAEQLAGGGITAFKLLRNTLAPDGTQMPRFLAWIEFADREQFNATFGELRHEGIHLGPHGELMRMVADFRVEFTESCE